MTIPILIVVGIVLLLGAGFLFWQLFMPGPRRHRALTKAKLSLAQGKPTEAIAIVQALQGEARLPKSWVERLRRESAEIVQQSEAAAIKEGRFEDAWKYSLTFAKNLGLDEATQQAAVLDAMLAEVRRLFALGTGTEQIEPVLALIRRLQALRTPHAEATFWEALCRIRLNETDQAIALLTASFEQGNKQFIDPPFYLGALLHRLGRPQEAIRLLGEANKVDASCPFVPFQMGLSLVAANGDSMLALSALKRGLGPRGLALWNTIPERLWVEAFPEAKSYVRRLALRHHYVCPLLGDNLQVIQRQGQLALAQANYRAGNYQEAADQFDKLLQHSPPTLPLLRGLGLSLAQLQRYDQAYKHLRTALEMDGQDAIVAGHLALCGALGKPTNPEDKPKNVAWALKLLARYPLQANAEWANLNNTVQAEARALDLPLSTEDQLRLCDQLASVHATTPAAAAAFAHLAATDPDALVPIHAWLYTRAVALHGVTSDQDLALFARTFRNAEPAKQFFERQKWSFEDVEYTYLRRAAVASPGQYPEALGPDYGPRGEAFLLARSRQQELAGKQDEALACAEVLARLDPRNFAANDRLACMLYRRGEIDRSVALLDSWRRLAPEDPLPVLRLAILEQERGQATKRAEGIEKALHLTRGPRRAAVAFLGARLALKESLALWGGDKPRSDPAALRSALTPTLNLLQTCLRDDPDHVEALCCLASVRSVLGDKEGLAEQAAVMDRPAVKDTRFHYLGAVCQLSARDYARTVELGQRAAADERFAVECQFLMGWAYLQQQNLPAAYQSLTKVAGNEKSPSTLYARAILGQISFARGAYEDAVKWWNSVDARRRMEWQLDEPLRQTVFLNGLQAFEKERYEQAGERFREASKLGLRDKRLSGLLTLSLVKAGQRLLYEQVK